MTAPVRYPGNPVLAPPPAWEPFLVLEPSVLPPSQWDGGNYAMLYTGDDRGHSRIGLAISPDGRRWFRLADNPVVGGGAGGWAGDANCPGWLRASDGTYHCFFAAGYSAGDLLHATSPDGFVWTLAGVALPRTAGGITTTAANSSVVVGADGVWRMLVEFFDSTGFWRTWLATSPDGYSWTLAAAPLESLRFGGGMYGGPDLHYLPGSLNGPWQLWYHASQGPGNVPTFLAHAAGADLLAWTRDAYPLFSVAGETFAGGPADQYADPCLLEAGGAVLCWYDVDRNGAGENGLDARIDLATFGGTLACLAATPPPVPPPPPLDLVVDFGSPGYSETGAWTTYGAGYGGSLRYANSGTGANGVVWQVTGLAPGNYEVLVDWLWDLNNRATNATYRVYDGTTLLAAVAVDQRYAPPGPTRGGLAFRSLGTFAVSGAALSVALTDAADGLVVADAAWFRQG